MRNEFDSARKWEAGYGLWRALLLLILVGLIAAVIMKTIAAWVAILAFIAAVVIIGLVANASDIGRYMRISSM
ncbi:MAG: hypothetical protein ABI878_09410 [Acidobacteriota bacterium]